MKGRADEKLALAFAAGVGGGLVSYCKSGRVRSALGCQLSAIAEFCQRDADVTPITHPASDLLLVLVRVKNQSMADCRLISDV